MEPSHLHSYFVKDASHLLSIKKTHLRNMLAVGSCQLTPLVKKATVAKKDETINDKTINSTDNISKGDVLNIKLYKGSLKAKVESVGK